MIIAPCPRVLRSDGTIRGYLGGREITGGVGLFAQLVANVASSTNDAQHRRHLESEEGEHTNGGTNTPSRGQTVVTTD